MSLSIQIMDEIKAAMRAKDTVALESLRAIKLKFLAQTASRFKRKSLQRQIKLLQIGKPRKTVLKFFYDKTVWI
jgi:uncharacterized protein YqeY